MGLEEIRNRPINRRVGNPHLVRNPLAGRKMALPVIAPCIHEGAVHTFCPSCRGSDAERKHVRACDHPERDYDECTRDLVNPKVQACNRCPDYQAAPAEEVRKRSIDAGLSPEDLKAHKEEVAKRRIAQRALAVPQGRVRYAPVPASPRSPTQRSPQQRPERRKWPLAPVWSYGVTTYKPDAVARSRHPDRREQGILKQTLSSLARTGFGSPILFVDGENDPRSWRDQFKLEVVCRSPHIGAFGNWVLGLVELMIRCPRADFYAMFQDDFVASLNLRTYLEHVPYPEKGYLNLYTFPKNQILARGREGFYPANQQGKGAVGLVFDREAALTLLTQQPGEYTAKRPQDRVRGHKFIDGGVVEAMKLAGFKEYVHNPSLIQHTGLHSTLGNPRHVRAASFRGEDFDLMTLLQPATPQSPITPSTTEGG